MKQLKVNDKDRRRASQGLACLLIGAAIVLTGCAHTADSVRNTSSASVEYHDPKVGVEQRRSVEDPENSAYAFQHIDEFYPVAIVKADPKPNDGLRVGEQIFDLNIAFDGETKSLEDALAATYTNGFLVMKDGKIVYEKYFNNSNQDSRFIGWSVSKSITSVLVGLALEDGLIKSVEDKLTDYLPEYSNTAFGETTLLNLLEMRAGTSYQEQSYGDKPSTVSTLVERSFFKQTHRFTDVSGVDITAIHAPGEVFNYSTLTTAILGRVIEAATGQTLAEYMSKRLWKPAGMQYDAYWMLDGEPGVGDEKAGGGVNASLRDYARLGQIMLDGGTWGGKQIVPAKWVSESTTHKRKESVIPKAPRGYGYQWWTVLGADTYEALGIFGQTISIDPATNTVIVKMSYWPERGGKAHMVANNEIIQGVRQAID